MHKLFYCFLFILFGASIPSFAQQHLVEFHTNFIGSVHNSQTTSAKPISEFGINVQRQMFPRTYAVIGLQGNTRNYQEKSTDTLNEFTGNLKYNQWMALVGVRHFFRQEILYTFNYFTEFDFTYTRLNTKGVYEGGNFGSAYYNYKRFKGMGIALKLGGLYHFYSPWYVAANVALYVNGGIEGEKSDYTILPETEPIIEKEDLINNQTIPRAAFEIRVGYRFNYY
jgi:hypothetical protein